MCLLTSEASGGTHHQIIYSELLHLELQIRMTQMLSKNGLSSVISQKSIFICSCGHPFSFYWVSMLLNQLTGIFLDH